MKLKISNTGKTICIKFPEGTEGRFAINHVDESLGVFSFSLTPDDNGRKVSGGFITIKSHIFGVWPVHGLIEVKAEELSSPHDESLYVAISVAKLPKPRPLFPRHASKPSKKVDDRPAISLKDAVAAVNKRKDEMGRELVLSINEDGKLRALLEYC